LRWALSVARFRTIMRVLQSLATAALMMVGGPCQTVAASTITDPGVIITLVNSNAKVSWDAAITGPANVEYSPDLSDWTTVSTSNSTGAFQHPFGPTGKGFYKLRWTPNALPPTPMMITVQASADPSHFSFYMPTLQIGKYEVMWDEWQEVRDWATANGYSDLAGVGAGSGSYHPVRQVNWFDAVKWCNAKSEKEGLTPVYRVKESGLVYRTGELKASFNLANGGFGPDPIDVDMNANGYRLPTTWEWEWAALGGVESQNYTYSGSNDVNAVAWYRDNSSGAVVDLSEGRGTWQVGQKAPNELGLHDMSGNVREWCQEYGLSEARRSWRGGGWGDDPEFCAVTFGTWGSSPEARGTHTGFRVVRNSE